MELIDWMRTHVSEPLTVERLADRAAMSPRHFARAFTTETGTTPVKAVERFRLETARTAVESSDASFEQIAESAGFRDPGRMRRAFLRTLGLPPQAAPPGASHNIAYGCGSCQATHAPLDCAVVCVLVLSVIAVWVRVAAYREYVPHAIARALDFFIEPGAAVWCVTIGKVFQAFPSDFRATLWFPWPTRWFGPRPVRSS